MTAVLWTWLVGYLVVRFKGLMLRKCLVPRSKWDHSWGIQRLTTDIVVARLTVRQFRQLRPICDYGVSAAVLSNGRDFRLFYKQRRLFS